jgi:hypothetical protein
MWNSLWKAASSIVHGHMQVLLRKEEHYPAVRRYRNTISHYNKEFGSSYFDDLFKVHESLGLGFRLGDVKIFASLTPIKEKEVFIIAHNNSTLESLASAFNHVLSRLVASGMSSFNFAAYLPPLKHVGGWESFPVIMRIVDRGSLSSKTADMGSMEVYSGQSIVETDPFKVAKIIKQ